MAAPALALTSEQLVAFQERLPPIRLTKYVPHTPTARQAAGLLLNDVREILYGGAAGGGKTDWLLMCALQYADIKGYAALLLRRTYAQASKADAFIPRSHEWLSNTDAVWNGLKTTWHFPSGATLEFGHLQHEIDKYNYQGGAYAFIGHDELTQFTESQYRYLFSRLRRLKGSNVPMRMRNGSNPGGEGHEWVKRRFITEREPGRLFLPAKLDDNPHLDDEEYRASLANLDPTTRAQLLNGDWVIRDAGSLFQSEWFEIVDAAPADARTVRAWDLAALNPKKQKRAKAKSADSDYVSGCKMSVSNGVFYIEDIKRKRLTPSGIELLLKQTAAVDGRRCRIWIEQEPGSSGVIVVDIYIRMLVGYDVRGQPATGDKLVRAGPLSAQAEAGNVKLVSGPWVGKFLDEMEVIGTESSAHDDQCDSASLAFSKLAKSHIQIRGGQAA